MKNLINFKRILSYLATIPPGQLNRNSISKHISLDNKTVMNYLNILNETGLVCLVKEDKSGSSLLKATEKIYLDNSNIYKVDVKHTLKSTKADMLVNYLPVGSRQATRYYAQAALDAGCAFVNCIPEFIASDQEWSKKFEEANLPVAGDDIKSQVGATILHRVVTKLFYDRGVLLDSTYQLNIGENTEIRM